MIFKILKGSQTQIWKKETNQSKERLKKSNQKKKEWKTKLKNWKSKAKIECEKWGTLDIFKKWN